MKKIGGAFPFLPLPQEENHFLSSLTPENGDLRYTMSGRCGIYFALMDLQKTDTRKVAYVPIYTCETVLAPFHKAGYRLMFYDINKDMTPIFDPAVLDQISVISICGYYGFSSYDRDFVAECSRRGIAVIEDTTHSVFSEDGIDPHCDYVAGSFRKWIGVSCGGFVIKTKGTFSDELMTPDADHLRWRKQCLSIEEATKEKDDLFWKSEMQLRQIFDSYGADDESICIMNHYPVSMLKQKRRENYQYLLDHLEPSDQYTVVFPKLTDGTVPSHFTVYAKNREAFREKLTQASIGCTSYWPVGPIVDLDGHPDAAYIYEHVCSIPCDQRYGEADMQRICDLLNRLSALSQQ